MNACIYMHISVCVRVRERVYVQSVSGEIIISLPLLGGIIDEFNFLFRTLSYFPSISQEA